MPRNSKRGMAIVYEGWLTKSPPNKRVWKAKWRRRWFTLRHSPDGPSHYYLDYYTDRSTNKLRGTIDLNDCEQIDAGLQLPRSNYDSKQIKGSVFSIRTRYRTYHLEADCVTEMEKWVDYICQACGMTESSTALRDESEQESNSLPPSPAPVVSSPSSEHYIAISECITGPPTTILESFQEQRNFIFNAQNQLAKTMPAYLTDPSCSVSQRPSSLKKFVRVTDCPTYANSDKVLHEKRFNTSLSAGHSPNSQLFAIAKRFTRLSIGDNNVNPCTPIPPRPPKPLRYSLDAIHKESFAGPRICEPNEIVANEPLHSPTSPVLFNSMHNKAIYANLINKSVYANCAQRDQRLNSDSQGPSSGYYNIDSPPAINRDLKPGRHNSRFNQHFMENSRNFVPHTLQYLDLDLDTPVSCSTYTKSQSHSPTNYKKVDFLKTNALNKTRLDNEASKRQENSHRE